MDPEGGCFHTRQIIHKKPIKSHLPAEMHHGLPWSTMVDHEFLYHGKTMVYHGKTMVNHGWDMAPRLTMVRPWLSMVQDDGCPWCKTMVVYGARPWLSMVQDHGCLWCKTMV